MSGKRQACTVCGSVAGREEAKFCDLCGSRYRSIRSGVTLNDPSQQTFELPFARHLWDRVAETYEKSRASKHAAKNMAAFFGELASIESKYAQSLTKLTTQSNYTKEIEKGEGPTVLASWRLILADVRRRGHVHTKYAEQLNGVIHTQLNSIRQILSKEKKQLSDQTDVATKTWKKATESYNKSKATYEKLKSDLETKNKGSRTDVDHAEETTSQAQLQEYSARNQYYRSITTTLEGLQKLELYRISATRRALSDALNAHVEMCTEDADIDNKTWSAVNAINDVTDTEHFVRATQSGAACPWMATETKSESSTTPSSVSLASAVAGSTVTNTPDHIDDLKSDVPSTSISSLSVPAGTYRGTYTGRLAYRLSLLSTSAAPAVNIDVRLPLDSLSSSSSNPEVPYHSFPMSQREQLQPTSWIPTSTSSFFTTSRSVMASQASSPTQSAAPSAPVSRNSSPPSTSRKMHTASVASIASARLSNTTAKTASLSTPLVDEWRKDQETWKLASYEQMILATNLLQDLNKEHRSTIEDIVRIMHDLSRDDHSSLLRPLISASNTIAQIMNLSPVQQASLMKLISYRVLLLRYVKVAAFSGYSAFQRWIDRQLAVILSALLFEINTQSDSDTDEPRRAETRTQVINLISAVRSSFILFLATNPTQEMAADSNDDCKTRLEELANIITSITTVLYPDKNKDSKERDARLILPSGLAQLMYQSLMITSLFQRLDADDDVDEKDDATSPRNEDLISRIHESATDILAALRPVKEAFRLSDAQHFITILRTIFHCITYQQNTLNLSMLDVECVASQKDADSVMPLFVIAVRNLVNTNFNMILQSKEDKENIKFLYWMIRLMGSSLSDYHQYEAHAVVTTFKLYCELLTWIGLTDVPQRCEYLMRHSIDTFYRSLHPIAESRPKTGSVFASPASSISSPSNPSPSKDIKATTLAPIPIPSTTTSGRLTPRSRTSTQQQRTSRSNTTEDVDDEIPSIKLQIHDDNMTTIDESLGPKRKEMKEWNINEWDTFTNKMMDAIGTDANHFTQRFIKNKFILANPGQITFTQLAESFGNDITELFNNRTNNIDEIFLHIINSLVKIADKLMSYFNLFTKEGRTQFLLNYPNITSICQQHMSTYTTVQKTRLNGFIERAMQLDSWHAVDSNNKFSSSVGDLFTMLSTITEGFFHYQKCIGPYAVNEIPTFVTMIMDVITKYGDNVANSCGSVGAVIPGTDVKYKQSKDPNVKDGLFAQMKKRISKGEEKKHVDGKTLSTELLEPMCVRLANLEFAQEKWNELAANIRLYWTEMGQKYNWLIKEIGNEEKDALSAASSTPSHLPVTGNLYLIWYHAYPQEYKLPVMIQPDYHTFEPVRTALTNQAEKIIELIGIYASYVDLRTVLLDQLYMPQPNSKNRIKDGAVQSKLDDCMSQIFHELPETLYPRVALSVLRHFINAINYVLLYGRRCIVAADVPLLRDDLEALTTVFLNELTQPQIHEVLLPTYDILMWMEKPTDDLLGIYAKGDTSNMSITLEQLARIISLRPGKSVEKFVKQLRIQNDR